MIHAVVIICHCRSTGMVNVCWWKTICPLSLLRYVCKSFCTFSSCVFLFFNFVSSFSICIFFLFFVRFALVFILLFCDRFGIGTWNVITIQMNRGQCTFAIWPDATHFAQIMTADDYNSYYIYRVQCEVMSWWWITDDGRWTSQMWCKRVLINLSTCNNNQFIIINVCSSQG